MIVDSEFLERIALADLHQAASRSQAAELGLKTLSQGSVFLSAGSRLPASAIVINRTLGLGLTETATRETVHEIIAGYRARQISRYFIQVHPQARPATIPDWLQAEGLVKARAWQKFVRGREVVEDQPTDLVVRRIGPEYGEAFARIVCAGFDLGEQAVSWLAHLPGRTGWHVFMSFDNHEPAGTGALFVHEDKAWVDYAATFPQYRQRGGQAAVLAARIRHALELGCRRLYTCTGVEVPGDPQHSYKNILKAGFREDYVRDNYAPPQ